MINITNITYLIHDTIHNVCHENIVDKGCREENSDMIFKTNACLYKGHNI